VLANGTTAHALERCFLIAARMVGSVAASANGAGTTVRDFAP
jgi:hypothetical protein